MRNTAALNSSMPAGNGGATGLVCPTGNGTASSNTNTTNTANCRKFSVPLLDNNVFWQNHSYFIGVGALGTGGTNQQHVVVLDNSFTGSAAATQPTTDSSITTSGSTVITGGTGACVTTGSRAAQYWDIGARGDTGPT